MKPRWRCAMTAAAVLAMVAALGASETSRSQTQRTVRSVENDARNRRTSVLVLADGQRFQTSLFQVRVLTALRTDRKAPYIVMVGRGCVNCDAQNSIYIHSPSDGPMQDEGHQPRYSYPGRLVSYSDGKTPVSDVRFFMGGCLSAYREALVWYVRERDDKGMWHSSVLAVHVEADKLAETVLKINLPSIDSTLQRVRQGVCRELPGVEGHSEP